MNHDKVTAQKYMYSLVLPGRVHFFRVSGTSSFAKSGIGFSRVSTRSGIFDFIEFWVVWDV